MNRHLLPDEIDLLLDGEVGFGASQLRAHLRECAHCRAELDEARVLVNALESLPRFAPAPLFAERVMARVQVYIPWHVALRDWAAGLLPQSTAGRAVAGVGFGSVAVALTLASLWVVTNLDAALFSLHLLVTESRALLLRGTEAALATAIGEPGLAAIRGAGPYGVVVAALALLLFAAGAARLLHTVISPRARVAGAGGR